MDPVTDHQPMAIGFQVDAPGHPAIADARTAALSRLIDTAVFAAPDQDDIGSAVTRYRRARAGPHAASIGRFVCPTSRLEELAGHLTSTMAADEAPWDVVALFDEDLVVGASKAATFHRYADPAARITAAEVAVPHGAGRVEIQATITAASSINGEVVPYVELPWTEAWEEEVPFATDQIADVRNALRQRTGAKLRTSDADFKASAEQVACFIMACTRRGLPFTAAGIDDALHSDGGEHVPPRHGFLNLLLATAVASERSDIPFHEIAAVVADGDAASFDVGAGSISYRQHRFATRSIGAARSSGLTAGSSSDFERCAAELAEVSFR